MIPARNPARFFATNLRILSSFIAGREDMVRESCMNVYRLSVLFASYACCIARGASPGLQTGTALTSLWLCTARPPCDGLMADASVLG